jgi:hypothetical protein
VAIIWAATNGYLDDVETARVGEFETGLYRNLESNFPKLLPAIAKEKAISDELSEQLKKAVLDYRRQAGFGTGEEPTTDKAEKPDTPDTADKTDATVGGAAVAEEHAEPAPKSGRAPSKARPARKPAARKSAGSTKGTKA